MNTELIHIEGGSCHSTGDDHESSGGSICIDEDEEEDDDEVELDEGGGNGKGTDGGGSSSGGPAAGGGGTKAHSACGKRKRERDSPCWKYFDDDPSDPTVVICTMCKKRLKTGGGTSNARQHVLRIHKDVATADGLIEPTIRQTKIDGKVLYHPNYVRQATKWIVMTYRVSEMSEWGNLVCPLNTAAVATLK